MPESPPRVRRTGRFDSHFVEIWYHKPGKRMFNILVEGGRVAKDYESFQGAFAMPHLLKFEAVVEDGVFDITFGAVVEGPKISALEIRRMDS